MKLDSTLHRCLQDVVKNNGYGILNNGDELYLLLSGKYSEYTTEWRILRRLYRTGEISQLTKAINSGKENEDNTINSICKSCSLQYGADPYTVYDVCKAFLLTTQEVPAYHSPVKGSFEKKTDYPPKPTYSYEKKEYIPQSDRITPNKNTAAYKNDTSMKSPPSGNPMKALVIFLILIICVFIGYQRLKANRTIVNQIDSVIAPKEQVTESNSVSSPVKVPDSVGKETTFGMYEQNVINGVGKEPIEWIVLDEKDGNVLLLSKYILDLKPFFSSTMNINWKNSSIREWLNSEFMHQAFSSSEISGIQSTYVSNSVSDGRPNFSVDGGESTYDKVFLLSYAEVQQYLPGEFAKRCTTTSYVEDQKKYIKTKNYYWWWLRSPGKRLDKALYIWQDGDCGESNVANDSCGVRPALWVNKNSVRLY